MHITIEQNVPLAPLTTLKVGGKAEHYVRVTTEAELTSARTYAKKNNLPIRILGGGSNTLVSDEGVGGLLIHIAIKGVEVVGTTEEVIKVVVGAGEVFDEFIKRCVEEGWWGLENLSHIPGSVGATPVQNVGAYGVEIQSLISQVRVFDTLEECYRLLVVEECNFGYRDSVFKQEPGRYIVTEVTFELSKIPERKLTYKDLEEYFKDTKEPSLLAIREAVIEIRSKKFPDWTVVGTAGSFFKNAIISSTEALMLERKYPELPMYPLSATQIKVPVGYIFDKILNAKGERIGSVGTFEGQALVLVAYEGATAKEVLAFSNTLAERTFEATGIVLEREVTCL